eukprot:5196626-Prymnesium_polylepis.2
MPWGIGAREPPRNRLVQMRCGDCIPSTQRVPCCIRQHDMYMCMSMCIGGTQRPLFSANDKAMASRGSRPGRGRAAGKRSVVCATPLPV